MYASKKYPLDVPLEHAKGRFDFSPPHPDSGRALGEAVVADHQRVDRQRDGGEEASAAQCSGEESVGPGHTSTQWHGSGVRGRRKRNCGQ